MIGYGVVECVPYQTFKEKMRITKELEKQNFYFEDLGQCLLINIENKEVIKTWQC